MCQHSSKSCHAPTVSAKGFAMPESPRAQPGPARLPGVSSIKLREDEIRMEPMAFHKT